MAVEPIPPTTRQVIDTLARDIAQQAHQSATSLAEKVDALKVLTAYYAVLQKAKPADEDVSDGVNFADFQSRLGHAGDEHGDAGGTQVRDRRRTRPS